MQSNRFPLKPDDGVDSEPGQHYLVCQSDLNRINLQISAVQQRLVELEDQVHAIKAAGAEVSP